MQKYNRKMYFSIGKCYSFMKKQLQIMIFDSMIASRHSANYFSPFFPQFCHVRDTFGNFHKLENASLFLLKATDKTNFCCGGW